MRYATKSVKETVKTNYIAKIAEKNHIKNHKRNNTIRQDFQGKKKDTKETHHYGNLIQTKNR